MSVILTLWRLRQEDCCVFEASLAYDVRPCFKTNIKGANKTAQPVKFLTYKHWRPEFKPWTPQALLRFSAAVIYT